MNPAALQDLASRLSGGVLTPDHPDYETTSAVHQLAAACRPAVIVQPPDAAGVVAAIDFARRHDLEIAVRGGGHSVAGHSTGDGVLVIDTRRLRELAVDPAARRARVGAGLSAGDVVAAAHEHGLTVPLGDTGAVGIAGITLGGGVGYLSRLHGLTIDHLLAVDLVTADGRRVTASATSEPDLFWALRGGGGNFGVVTALEYGLVDAGTVYSGALLLPATRDVLRAITPLAGAAPRGLTVIANFMPAPPAPFVPPDLVGRPVVAVMGVFCGPPDEGEAAWAPFRALARPIADTVGPMPYPAIYRYTEAAAMPNMTVNRSMFVDVVDDTMVDTLREAYASSPGAMTLLQFRVLGGAVGDVPNDATAYGHRTAPILLTCLAAAGSPAGLDACRVWGNGLRDRLHVNGLGGYVNFLEDECEASVREAYPLSTYRRLAAVKAAWDPDNVFRRNHNIRPAG